MKRSTASTVTYVVALAALTVLMPWKATGTAEFENRAMFAVVITVVLAVFTRYGLELLVGRSDESQSRVSARGGIRLGSLTLGYWPLVKYSLASSLAIGLLGITLGTSHLMTATGAFSVTVGGQQLTFVIAELLVARKSVQGAKLLSRMIALVALVALATLFASASNITFMAQRPPVPPRFSESTNLVFAIPALFAAIAAIAGWIRIQGNDRSAES